MSIQSLGDDVLLKVLSICDVYTALSVSMVNKYLREIALAKQLWLWLVCDLVRRGILDNPPAEDLDGYSTGQLIGEVRRVVAGPSSWSPGSSSSPTVDRRLSFATHLAAIYRTRLLPGGRYLALQTRKQVHIYGVAAGRCIWQHAAGYRDTAWAVDMIEVGIMARVLLLPRGLSGRPDISVHEVDLASGRSHEVFNLDLHTIDYGFDRMASILGDFFVVVRDDPRMRVFLLVNWRLCTYVFLGYEGWQYSSPQAVLLPDHIAVSYAEGAPPHQQILAVTSFISLEPHWNGLEGINPDTALFAHNIPRTFQERLMFDNQPLCNTTCFKLFVFASPLHLDTYRIIVYACQAEAPRRSVAAKLRSSLRRGPPAEKLRGALVSYSFTVGESPTAPAAWHLVSILRAAPARQLPRSQMSYAGYWIDQRLHEEDESLEERLAVADVRCMRAGAEWAHTRTVMKRALEWDNMYVAESGAVIGQMGSFIIISYYV